MEQKCPCLEMIDDKASKLFKALSDPNRMAILSRLCDCKPESNVGTISSCCEVDLSVVSRHLNILKQAGIINAEKRGKEVFYSLNTKELVHTLRAIANYLEKNET
jgi:DNA-binding transcriptional ArsR family regulator